MYSTVGISQCNILCIYTKIPLKPGDLKPHYLGELENSFRHKVCMDFSLTSLLQLDCFIS